MNYDITIIGGGIIGLATAYLIKERAPDLKVLLLEKEKNIALHQTGNNSGVIHAGVYYKPGSLKAANCRTGYSMLLNFCSQNEIKFELCGKLIVATKTAELAPLDELYVRAIKNGLDRVKMIHSNEIARYEPFASGIKAIFVPYTGIVNYKDVARKYMELFLEKGGTVMLNQEVTQIRHHAASSVVMTSDDLAVETTLVVNTAGLQSDRIAKMNEQNLDVRIIPFRGEYYELRPESRHLVKGLIYPVPDPKFPFLGVHFTKKINGSVEAGPNAVFAFKREGYNRRSFSASDVFESLKWPGFHSVIRKYWKTGIGEYYRSLSKSAFTRALQQLVPAIRKEDLIEGGAGVRAQACDRNGGLVDDFLIRENKNQIDILNSPSPAATASLAIATAIVNRINDNHFSLKINNKPSKLHDTLPEL
jgi:(S)-2-hydroxyglutarate dehydrogenase